MKNKQLLKITQAAMIAALAYVSFLLIRIDIPVGVEKTSVHISNSFIVLGALLLGGVWGGLAGAVGLSIADLFAGYVTSAPKTFILKLVIGLIAGAIARKVFHIEKDDSVKGQTKIALFASIAALGCNVVLDPLFGYFYKTYIFGVPQDMSATLAKIGSLSTLMNAIVSTVLVTLVWPVLYAALKKAHLLPWTAEESVEEIAHAEKA